MHLLFFLSLATVFCDQDSNNDNDNAINSNADPEHLHVAPVYWDPYHQQRAFYPAPWPESRNQRLYNGRPHYYWIPSRQRERGPRQQRPYYPPPQEQDEQQQQSCQSMDPMQLVSKLEGTVNTISRAKDSLEQFISSLRTMRLCEIPREMFGAVRLASSLTRDVQQAIESTHPECARQHISSAFSQAVSSLRTGQKDLASVVSKLIRNPLGELQDLKNEYHDLEETVADTLSTVMSFIASKHDSSNDNDSGNSDASNGDSSGATSSDAGFAAFTDFSVSPSTTAAGFATDTAADPGNKDGVYTPWSNAPAADDETPTPATDAGQWYTFSTAATFVFTGTENDEYTFTTSDTFVFTAIPQAGSSSAVPTTLGGLNVMQNAKASPAIGVPSRGAQQVSETSSIQVPSASTSPVVSPTSSVGSNAPKTTSPNFVNDQTFRARVIEAHPRVEKRAASGPLMESDLKAVPGMMFTGSLGPFAPNSISFVQHHSGPIASSTFLETASTSPVS